jgi:hypothetical protein
MKQLYIHGGKAYLVLRRVISEKFLLKGTEPNMEYVKTYRDWVGSDHVLRDQTHFLFCETIPDVEFEEIKEEVETES